MAINFLNNPKVGDNVKIEIGNSSDLQIFHDGSNSYIKTSSGNLIIQNGVNDADIIFKAYNSAGNLDTYFDIDGSAGVTKFRINTRHLDNVEARFGGSNDLRIYHDGSNSYIDETGTGALYIQSNTVNLRSSTGEWFMEGIADGAVNLYHNNVKKFETTANGVNIVDSELGIGSGHGTASPGNAVVFAPYGSGTNIAGGEIQFYSGRSTGNAAGGDIKFYISPTGSSGSSSNTHVQVLSLNAGLSATFAGTITTGGDLTIGGTGGIFIPAYIYHVGDTNTFFGFSANDNFVVNTSGSERFRINSSGFVGIGSTSPVAPLEVKSSETNHLTLYRPANTTEGNAGGMNFDGNDADSNQQTYAKIESFTDDATAGSHAGKLRFSIAKANDGIISAMTIQKDAQLSLNQYGQGSYTGTAAYTLQVDSAGNIIEGSTSGGGGTVTGSGAATRVAFWSGTSALSSDSNLYWDNTNNRLGIGTSTPSELLHVYHATTNTLAYLQSGDATTVFAMADTGGSTRLVSDGGKFIFRVGGTASTAGSNTTEAMRIKSDGNVGIATTNPTSKLHVGGNVFASEFDLPSGGKLDWANGDARIVEGLVNNYSLSFQTYNGSSLTTALRLDGDNKAAFAGDLVIPNAIVHAGDTNTYIQFHNTDEFRVVVAGNERFEVVNSGTTINNALTVNGDALIRDATPVVIIRDSNGTTPSNTLGYVSMQEADGTEVAFMGMGSGSNSHLYLAGGAGTDIMIRTDATTAMFIDTNQRVGVGTTSPSYKFTVNDSTANGRGIQVVQSATSGTNYGIQGGAFGSGATKNIGLSITVEGATTNDAAHFIGGNVGIGTTSPARILHIESDTTAAIQLENTSEADSFIDFKNPSRTFRVGYDDSTDLFKIAVTNFNDNSLVVNSSGNVGIDTTSPVTALDVRGEVSVAYNASYGLRFYNNARNNWSSIGNNVASGTAANLVFKDSTGEVMRITGGKVGIGNTSPAKKLEISSGTSGDGILLTGTGSFANGASRNIEFSHSDTDTSYASAIKFEVKDASAHGGQIGFFTDAGPSSSGTLGSLIRAMTIDPNQNVGIGTSSPRNDANFITLQVGNTTTAASQIVLDDNDSNGPWRIISNQSLIINDNASERMRINSGGNVGIGTSNMQAKLTVQGQLRSSANIVSNSGYDAFYIGSSRTIDDYGGLYKNYFTMKLQTPAGAHAYGDLRFQLANSTSTTAEIDVMTLSYTGKVGIGTTSPSQKLSVNGGKLLVQDVHSSGDTPPALTLGQLNNQYQSGIQSNGHLTSKVVGSGNWYWYDDANIRMYLSNAGNLGIGTTSASQKLEVRGNSLADKSLGIRTNYATQAGWSPVTSLSSATGFFGGNFTINGSSAENNIAYGENEKGQRGLIWRAQNNDASSNADGGWNKTILNLDNNMSYMSIAYVKRVGTNTSGSFYHGCSGANTLNLNGTTNTNPYFRSFSINNLPQDVWCVSIGIIQANNDSNTINPSIGGIYRLDTGQKITALGTAQSFKMRGANNSQSHRTYLYYSTSSSAELNWSNPGFYAMDGSEPTLSEIVEGANSAGDYLPLSGGTMTGNINYNDNVKAVFGAGPDFEISHNGTTNQNKITSLLGRQLLINTNNFTVNNQGDTENMITASSDGSVNLFYNGSQHFRTISVGAEVTGRLKSTSIEMNPNYDASNLYFVLNKKQANDGGIILTSKTAAGATQNDWQIVNIGTSADLRFYAYGLGGPALTLDRENGNATFAGDVNVQDNLYLQDGSTVRAKIQLNSSDRDDLDIKAVSLGSKMKFFTVDTERMRIDDSGNVGIGTTAPDAKLVVKDDSSVVYDASAYQKTFRIEKKNTSGSNQFANIRFSVTGYSGQTTAEASIGVVQTSNASSGNLVFSTRHSGTRSEKMRITSAGNVGIGTTNPNSTLTVLGANSAAGGITLTSSTSNSTQKVGRIKTQHYNTAEEPFTAIVTNAQSTANLVNIGGSSGAENAATIIKLFTAANNTTLTGTERMRIDSSGNVGIGTTSPSHTLSVSGTFRYVNGLEQSGQVSSGEPENAPDFTPDAYLDIKVNGTDYLIPLFTKQT